MTTDKIKVIDSCFISTFQIGVSEEISPQYLPEFIRTSIFNSNIDTDENSWLYYKFLPSTLSYEILIFNHEFKNNFILEPFIFLSYYKNDIEINTTDLFITDKYFVLFKNKEFILLKNITNIEKDDIQRYIEQSYEIKIDNKIVLTKDEINQIKNNHLIDNPKIKYNFIKLHKKNSFRYFLYFICLCTICFTYIIFTKTDNKNDINIQSNKDSLETKYYNKLLTIDKNHKSNLINKTIDLFKYLKINKITIESLKYYKSKVHLNIVHNDKRKLLDFTTIYNQKVDIKSLNFIEDTQKYKMDISIEY